MTPHDRCVPFFVPLFTRVPRVFHCSLQSPNPLGHSDSVEYRYPMRRSCITGRLTESRGLFTPLCLTSALVKAAADTSNDQALTLMSTGRLFPVLHTTRVSCTFTFLMVLWLLCTHVTRVSKRSVNPRKLLALLWSELWTDGLGGGATLIRPPCVPCSKIEFGSFCSIVQISDNLPCQSRHTPRLPASPCLVRVGLHILHPTHRAPPRCNSCNSVCMQRKPHVLWSEGRVVCTLPVVFPGLARNADHHPNHSIGVLDDPWNDGSSIAILRVKHCGS